MNTGTNRPSGSFKILVQLFILTCYGLKRTRKLNKWTNEFWIILRLQTEKTMITWNRAVFTWLSKGIGFGFGFGFTTPFGWLVYLLWFWFYDSQVKTALINQCSLFCDQSQERPGLASMPQNHKLVNNVHKILSKKACIKYKILTFYWLPVVPVSTDGTV